MNFPAQIKIGGFWWTVQKREQTILHEILHAVWMSQGLDRMSGFEGKEGRKNEEAVVHALSMGLYQVFRDNPNITFTA